MKGKWQQSRLGDVASIKYGYTAKASASGSGPKFLRITDIQNNTVNWGDVPTCEISSADFKKHRLQAEDMVFARTGATTGKSYRIVAAPEAVPASYLIRVRVTNEALYSNFLELFFQSEEYWSQIKKGTSGSAQGGFNASKLSELMIEFPRLKEQKRIVAILDEAFAGIDTAIANTEKNLANARELFESYLNAVFSQRGDPVKNARNVAGWEDVYLECIFAVGSSKRVLKSQWKTSGVPFYRGREVTKLAAAGSVENELFISEELFSEFKTKYGVPETGDILITAIGTIGNSYVVKPKDRFYFKDASVLWLSKKSDDDSNFVNYWLKSNQFKGQLEKDNGATVDTLTIGKLKSARIGIPRLPEQKRIVAVLDELSTESRRLETLSQQKLTALAELKQCLLQKAFSGELTADAADAVDTVKAALA